MVVPDRVVQAQRLVAPAPLSHRAGRGGRRRSSARRAGAAARRARCRPGHHRRSAPRAGSPYRARLLSRRRRSSQDWRSALIPVVGAREVARWPRCSSWPVSSRSAVSSVEEPSPSRSRRWPTPRPTSVSNSSHAWVTPPPASTRVAPLTRKSYGRARASVPSSRRCTPDGPSTVTMFQLIAIRSRQKLSVANRAAAASMSLIPDRGVERLQPA